MKLPNLLKYPPIQEEGLATFIEEMKVVAKKCPHDLHDVDEAPDDSCFRGMFFEGMEICLSLTFESFQNLQGWHLACVLSNHCRVPPKILDKIHKVVFEGEMNSPVGRVLELPDVGKTNVKQFVMLTPN